ncbi:MAG: hypothetical protein AAF787_10225 [Chloroflexota bacterium]
MKIPFYRAVKTFTGFRYMVEVDGKSILLAYGVYYGRRDEVQQ